MNGTQVIGGFKKELWEFNRILFWLPIVVGVLLLGAPIIQLALLQDYQVDRIIDALRQMDDTDAVVLAPNVMQSIISSIFAPFMLISLLVQFYYLTSCLYDERRDLSVLFWRSMPVSDGQTIAIKLIMGAILIPTVFMLTATAVVLIAVLLLLGACIILQSTFDLSLWWVWSHLDLLSTLSALWLSLVPYSLWLLPVFTWLMLASMYANKAPFLWASVPIVIALLIEAFVVAYFKLEVGLLAQSFTEYFNFSQEIIPRDVFKQENNKLLLFTAFGSKITLIGCLLSALFIFLTYWLRVKNRHR